MSQSQKTPRGPRKEPKRTTDGEDTAVVPFRASDPLESTMPPTPLRELLAAEGASVGVFTETASLLATVQEAGGEQYPVFPVDSWQALCEAVTERRCGIALLDIDALSGALTDRLTELARLNPALVTLVASTRERADGLLNLLAERKIHRLLIKPPTVGITRLLLESSVNRYIELRRRPELQAQAQPARSSSLAGWPSWLLAGGLVVGLLATVALTSYMNRPEPVSVTAPLPAAEPSVNNVPASTPNTAAIAEPAAFASPEAPFPGSDRVTLPNMGARPEGAAVAGSIGAGASALTGPQPPAGPDPAEIDAQFSAAEVALIADDWDTAARLLDELATLDPASTRVAFLRAQLDRARLAAEEAAAAAEAAALAAQAAAARSELTSLVGLARTRLTQQQLDSPAGDSALDYLARARAVDPEAPEVASLTAELGAALLTAAEIQLADGEFAVAEALFLRARALGVNEEDVVALELSLTYARDTLAQAEQSALLAEADERLADGRLFAPADSALAAVLEVQRLNPDHPGLPAAFDALEQALQAAAESALAAADWNPAEAAIAALSRAGAPLATLNALEAELTFGRRQGAYLAEPAPAGELVIIAFEPPIYPARAQNRGTEGWVDLDFVVDRDGRPREIVTAGAEPVGEFEAAALAAAETYVFEPFELDGRTYERRVRLRMRFTLQ